MATPRSEGTRAPRRKSLAGCLLGLLFLLIIAGLGLDQAGIIWIPGIPKFFMREPARAEAREIPEEQPSAPEEPVAVERPVSAAAATAAPSRRAAEQKEAEDRAARQAQQRVQRVADIVGKLSPETATETLEEMPFEEQVAVIRLLEDGTVAKILEDMDARDRAKVLQALKQPLRAPIESGGKITEESSQAGETTSRPLLPAPASQD